MKQKHLSPQFELPGSNDVFNLAIEATEDGERIRRELEAARNNQLLSKALEEERQPDLL